MPSIQILTVKTFESERFEFLGKTKKILSVVIFLFSVKSFFDWIEAAFFAAIDGPVGSGGQVVHGREGGPVCVVLAG